MPIQVFIIKYNIYLFRIKNEIIKLITRFIKIESRKIVTNISRRLNLRRKSFVRNEINERYGVFDRLE